MCSRIENGKSFVAISERWTTANAAPRVRRRDVDASALVESINSITFSRK